MLFECKFDQISVNGEIIVIGWNPFIRFLILHNFTVILAEHRVVSPVGVDVVLLRTGHKLLILKDQGLSDVIL